MSTLSLLFLLSFASASPACDAADPSGLGEVAAAVEASHPLWAPTRLLFGEGRPTAAVSAAREALSGELDDETRRLLQRLVDTAIVLEVVLVAVEAGEPAIVSHLARRLPGRLEGLAAELGLDALDASALIELAEGLHRVRSAGQLEALMEGAAHTFGKDLVHSMSTDPVFRP